MKLVRISSTWCVSCIIMNKLWNQLKEKYPEFEYMEYDYDLDDEAKSYEPGKILPIIIILKDNKEIKRIVGEKSKNELFKEVCKLLNLSDDEFMDKLPAFFDVLSTDQRFIMLENGLWDLKTKHSVKVVVDNEDEEDEDIEEDLELDDIEEEQEEDIYAEDNDDDDIADDDDLKDLVIIDEDEEQMV